MSNPQESFLDMLIAAMKDAAITGDLTQLQTTITPAETGKQSIVRIIIVPEKMDFTWPKDQPLGTDERKN